MRPRGVEESNTWPPGTPADAARSSLDDSRALPTARSAQVDAARSAPSAHQLESTLERLEQVSTAAQVVCFTLADASAGVHARRRPAKLRQRTPQEPADAELRQSRCHGDARLRRRCHHGSPGRRGQRSTGPRRGTISPLWCVAPTATRGAVCSFILSLPLQLDRRPNAASHCLPRRLTAAHRAPGKHPRAITLASTTSWQAAARMATRTCTATSIAAMKRASTADGHAAATTIAPPPCAALALVSTLSRLSSACAMLTRSDSLSPCFSHGRHGRRAQRRLRACRRASPCGRERQLLPHPSGASCARTVVRRRA